MPKKKLRIAVFISGTGRTLKNFIDWIQAGKMSAEIVVVISSAANVAGLQYGEEESIPVEIIERSQYGSLNEFSEANFNVCRSHRADYAVLAGYLRLLEIPKDFENRVLNIHPSLIPAFCGKGYYGNIVHSKVLEYGAKVSGCTVHFVDQDYDRGPIILQKTVEVYENDTPDTLNNRVFAAECLAYPEAIELIAEGRVSVKGRRVRIAPPKDSPRRNEINF
ncbi:MAG: phosphoribosylglycinamide formyltransferase [Planctomycetaceae bacterium]|jgi:formyltetrahydrofolate-dependent phosphoribosylglycinamide formyltransferase|nr:phosphoribosylglycinamide formyltransferase [Planctomycetaceae bacterium]